MKEPRASIVDVPEREDRVGVDAERSISRNNFNIFFKLNKTYKIKVPMILINHSKQISITQNISRDTIIKLVKKRIKAARKRDTCYVGKQTNCKILVRNNAILKSME